MFDSNKLYSLKYVESVIEQNEALVLDCLEGCLLDDLLFELDDKLYAALEVYVNVMSSAYKVYSGEDSVVWEIWNNREQQIEALTN